MLTVTIRTDSGVLEIAETDNFGVKLMVADETGAKWHQLTYGDISKLRRAFTAILGDGDD